MRDGKDYNSIVFGLCIVAALVVLIGGIIVNIAVNAQTIDLEAVKQIESGGNPKAVSQVGAVGLFQIMPITLEEYNIFHASNYTRKDLFDPGINREIADWYLTERIPSMLDHYGKPVTTRNVLWAYNAGIGNLVDGVLPEETKRYFHKYKKLVG